MEYLQKKKVTELKQIAKDHGVEKPYKLRKAQLIEVLSNIPEVMEEMQNLQEQTPTPTTEPETIKYHYYCIHKRQKSRCKECGGSQICEHKRNKAYCKECGGSQICEHKKQRAYCKECGGWQICEHKKQKSYCKECKGSQICEHNRFKKHCKECNTTQ